MSSLHQYLGSRCSVSKPSSTDDESHPNFQGHEILNKLKPHVLQSGFQDNIYSRRKLPTDRQSLISPQTKFQNLSSEPSNLNLRWRSSHPVSASGLPNAIDSLSCKRSELRSDADLCPDIFETDLENYDNTVSSSDPDDHDSHGHWPHFNRDIINEFNQYSNVKTTHEMTWRHGNEQGNHRRYYDQFQEDTGRKLIKDVKNNIDDIEDRTIDKDRVMLKEAITKRFISSQDDDEVCDSLYPQS